MLALISVQNSFIDLGIRQISAACRSQDIPTFVLWLNREPHELLTDRDLDQVAAWVRQTGALAVGLNVMSVHLSLAGQITATIRNTLGIPVIWGGAHAILEPRQSVQEADFVCVGEGEWTIAPLMEAIRRRQVSPDIRNFWYRHNETLVMNDREIVKDLDALPLPDHSIRDHWIMSKSGRIDAATCSLFREGFPWNAGRHIIMSSRGCPNHCTYCCSTAMRRLFGPKWNARFRSVEHFMDEIRTILDHVPFIRTFAIMDDSFFCKPSGWIDDFCREFKKTGASFGVLLHPGSVTHERIAMLVDSGLIGIQMGLQSGSERISGAIFKRPESVADFKNAAAVLDDFSDRLHSRTYDVIVDNPYETDQDREATLRVLLDLNKPFNIDLFSLTLYPGTQLYEEYQQAGTDIPEDLACENKNFIEHHQTPMNRLLRLVHSNPRFIIRFLLSAYHAPLGKSLIILFDSVWEQGIRRLLRAIKHLSFRLISHPGHPGDDPLTGRE